MKLNLPLPTEPAQRSQVNVKLSMSNCQRRLVNVKLRANFPRKSLKESIANNHWHTEYVEKLKLLKKSVKRNKRREEENTITLEQKLG